MTFTVVPSLSVFRAAVRSQGRIIGALMIREALGRFGHQNLGFFWIIAEPLVLTIGVMLMFYATGRMHGREVGVIPFVLSAYSLLTLWRHQCSGSVHVLRKNAGLLFHRNIRLLDIMIARMVLDSLGGLSAFSIAYGMLTLFELMDDLDDPLLVAGAWFFMSWFSLGFGLVLAGVTELVESAEHFVAPTLYLVLPFTGAFVMVVWLPDYIQRAFLFSPLVNIFEMFRCGLFGSQVPTYWSVTYIGCWCFFLTAIGLPLIHEAQKRVTVE